MTTAEIIVACGEVGPFVVIGGHAVIAHGHSRTTLDLDLLVRRSDRETWTKALKRLEYQSVHSHDSFEQFRSLRGAIDVDLMYVADATFDGINVVAKEFSFGNASCRIASLQHLIALKLHVLKQGLAHRMLGDMDDIIQLALVNKLDIKQPEWRQIFEKYGSVDLYEKVRNATSS